MTVLRISAGSLLAMMWLTSAVLAQQSTEAELIRRLDSNRNGVLESGEIPPQARGQIARLARAARLNPNEPLPVNRLERQLRRGPAGEREADDRDARRGEDRWAGRRRWEGDRGERGSRGEEQRGGGRWGGGGPWGGGPWGERREGGGDWRGRRGDGGDEGRPRRGGNDGPVRNGRDAAGGESAVASLDPKFAFGPGEGARVRGFGPADVAAPPLEEQYDERTLRLVDRMLSRSDRNENGRLESEEWDGMRFMGDPQEADANRDGVLTRDELARQIADRFGSNRSEDDGGRGRWGDRPPFGGGPGRFPWGPGMAPDEGRGGEARGGEGRFGRGRGEGDERRFARGGRPGGDGESPFGRRFNRGDDGDDNDGGRRRGGRGFGWPGGDQQDPAERLRFFAQRMLEQNDGNRNGKLERDEWSQMRGRYADADKNNDSIITLDELVEHMSNGARGGGFGWGPRPEPRGEERSDEGPRGRRGGRDGQSRPSESEKKSYRFMSPAERIESILSGRDRDWFLDHDIDGDGQIAMSEFAESWTSDKIKEFAELDTNQDGMLTPLEYQRARSE